MLATDEAGAVGETGSGIAAVCCGAVTGWAVEDGAGCDVSAAMRAEEPPKSAEAVRLVLTGLVDADFTSGAGVGAGVLAGVLIAVVASAVGAVSATGCGAGGTGAGVGMLEAVCTAAGCMLLPDML